MEAANRISWSFVIVFCSRHHTSPSSEKNMPSNIEVTFQKFRMRGALLFFSSSPSVATHKACCSRIRLTANVVRRQTTMMTNVKSLQGRLKPWRVYQKQTKLVATKKNKDEGSKQTSRFAINDSRKNSLRKFSFLTSSFYATVEIIFHVKTISRYR